MSIAFVHEKWMQYFTVIAEKATRHIPDNNIKNRPHRGTAQQSRIVSINLKVGNESFIIFRLSCLYPYFFLLLLAIITPFYILVMTYAGVQLFLHVKEHILRGVTPSLSLLLTILNPTVLFWCDVCLCDTQQGRFELLQLTAGYTHQCRVKA
jgi:hypothetical protein